MLDRCKRLGVYLSNIDACAVLVSKPESRRYFTGFTGSAGVAVIDAAAAKKFLFVDFRYMEQATAQCPDWEIIMVTQKSMQDIAARTKAEGWQNMAFESDFVTVDAMSGLSAAFAGIKLLPCKLSDLRAVKDDEEVAIIKAAAVIAEKALHEILPLIVPGAVERDIAIALECAMRKAGADGSAFDIIVASGARSALPHGRASDKVIEYGDFVTLDFGAYYRGYNSDITRTFVVGKASAKHREVYGTVLKAQLAALNAVRTGAVNTEVDKVARDIIAAAGYGECFGHGLGHGLGMLVHEEPRLSYASASAPLIDGNIVTVEPGIYIPGFGGVRIEDDVVVRDRGPEILTSFSKELIEL